MIIFSNFYHPSLLQYSIFSLTTLIQKKLLSSLTISSSPKPFPFSNLHPVKEKKTQRKKKKNTREVAQEEYTRGIKRITRVSDSVLYIVLHHPPF
jgi:hypothetical protein